MKFKTKLALAVAKSAKINLASQALDDVTLYFLDGDELREGIEVFDLDESGEYILFQDGSYKWGDRTVIVTDGVVTSITEDSTGQGLQDEGTEGATEEAVDENYDILKDVIVKVVEDAIDNMDSSSMEELKKLSQKLSKVEKDLSDTRAELSETKKELKLAKQGSAKSFTDPNPGKYKPTISTAEAELAKFGIK